MQSEAKTVEEYLASLPDDHRETLEAIRAVILKNLPKGYAEGMQYGMIGYFVPHEIFPSGYHCNPNEPLPFGGLASQKNYMSMYFMCIYSDPENQAWFVKEWKKSGKKLDMGKSCIRFKSLEDVPLDVIGKLVKRVPVKKFIGFYKSALKAGASRKASASPRKKPAPQK